ncbi:MAG: SAM-dependent methyltransferase [Armatimonadaceae bacterium]
MSNAPQLFATCDYNAPLSPECVSWLCKALKVREKAHFVDLGCGWGQLLIDIVMMLPGSTGIGYDSDQLLIEHADVCAAKRGISDRIRFVQEDCTLVAERCDVLICIGSTHAWNTLGSALGTFYQLLQPAGQLILGVPFWEHPPSNAACEAIGTSPDGLPSEMSLRSMVSDSGFAITGFRASTLAEWDAFEIAWCASRVIWLRENPNRPDFAKYADQLEKHRAMWLDGYRTYLGFAVIVATKQSSTLTEH